MKGNVKYPANREDGVFNVHVETEYMTCSLSTCRRAHSISNGKSFCNTGVSAQSIPPPPSNYTRVDYGGSQNLPRGSFDPDSTPG